MQCLMRGRESRARGQKEIETRNKPKMMDVSGWAKWVKATGRYMLSEDMDKVWAVNNNVSKLAHCDKHMLLLLRLNLR